MLVVVDHDYDAAIVVVQVAGGDVAEDGLGAPEPVPGRHPGIHPNPVAGQPKSVGVGIRVRLPGVGLDDLIRQVGELAELGVERRCVDIASELVLGDVDIVALVDPLRWCQLRILRNSSRIPDLVVFVFEHHIFGSGDLVLFDSLEFERALKRFPEPTILDKRVRSQKAVTHRRAQV